MMGRLKRDQGQFFYSFCLDEVVPDDHRVREIAGVLDLSWVHPELACYYSPLGRPSIDPAWSRASRRSRVTEPRPARVAAGCPARAARLGRRQCGACTVHVDGRRVASCAPGIPSLRHADVARGLLRGNWD
jgi:hypothetical protein